MNPTTDNQNDDSSGDDRGQAIQINEHTIDDPQTPEERSPRHDERHGRRDVPESDQALQINDNTIADQK